MGGSALFEGRFELECTLLCPTANDLAAPGFADRLTVRSAV